MRRRLNSVNNVIDILEAFAVVSPSWTVSALARRIGLSKASTHTLLANLGARKIVEKDEETAVYSLGIRFWEIGLKVAASNKLSVVCDPWLRRLRDQSAESCYLAIYDRGEALYVGKAESENPIQAYTPLGARSPCHCTASGKVLLAAQDDAEIARMLTGPFTAFSATTVTNSSDAHKMIAKVKKQGYAISSGEWRAEVQSVAVPLVIHGQTRAALCITGPSYRFNATRAVALIADLKRAAAEMQAAFGIETSEARLPKTAARRPRRTTGTRTAKSTSRSKVHQFALNPRR
jgi:DNA-binding IclR family transcriptional regulator